MLPTEAILAKSQKDGVYVKDLAYKAMNEYLTEEHSRVMKHIDELGVKTGSVVYQIMTQSMRIQEGVIGVVIKELSKNGIFVPAGLLRATWESAFGKDFDRYKKDYPFDERKSDEATIRNLEEWDRKNKQKKK